MARGGQTPIRLCTSSRRIARRGHLWLSAPLHVARRRSHIRDVHVNGIGRDQPGNVMFRPSVRRRDRRYAPGARQRKVGVPMVALRTVLVIALISAACSSSHPGGKASSPSTPVPSSSSTIDRTIGLAAARARYTRLVAPVVAEEAGFRAFMDQHGDQPPLTGLRDHVVEFGARVRAFSVTLQGTRWPTRVQAAVDRLIERLADCVAATRVASDDDTVVAMVDDFAKCDANGASELVRERLGLPAR